MNIDSAVVFRYISPLYDHPIVCDWAKIVSKIVRKFSQFVGAPSYYRASYTGDLILSFL